VLNEISPFTCLLSAIRDVAIMFKKMVMVADRQCW
jgi:hypothetical protein